MNAVNEEPRLVHEPDPDDVSQARVQGFLRWLATERDVELSSWDELYRWSVDSLEDFWVAVWDYFGVQAHAPYRTVLESRAMPGARWFPGATLNYAEHCFGTDQDAAEVAVVAYSQTRPPLQLRFGELEEQVRRARAGLQRLGVGLGLSLIHI